jgi:hypothetical protein
MRKTTICSFILLCSIVSLGQNQPQWKVVKSVILRNQASPISSTVVFTPKVPGFYRVSGYLSVAGQGSGHWGLYFNWTDLSGEFTGVGVGVDFDNQPNWISLPPLPFVTSAGQPFTYNVPGSSGTYNVVFTIEQLQ